MLNITRKKQLFSLKHDLNCCFNHHLKKMQCSICLHRNPPSLPVVTKCGHLYCWQCLKQWLQKSARCPICKRKLDVSSGVVPIYGNSGDEEEQEEEEQDIDDRPHLYNNTDSSLLILKLTTIYILILSIGALLIY